MSEHFCKEKTRATLFMNQKSSRQQFKKLYFFKQPQSQKLKTLKYLELSEEVIIKTSEAVVGQIQRGEGYQIRKYVLLKKQT